jgi:serine/threonine protein kinase
LYGLTDNGVIIMEYVEGSTLSAVLSGGFMTNAERACLFKSFAQVASALLYLRRKSVVHRDLKPANILIENFVRFDSGLPQPVLPLILMVCFQTDYSKVTAKLCDFGLALPVHLTADSLARLSGVIRIHSRKLAQSSAEPKYSEKTFDALNPEQDWKAFKYMLDGVVRRNLSLSGFASPSASSNSVLPPDPVLDKIQVLLSEFEDLPPAEVISTLLRFSREYLQAGSTPHTPATRRLTRTTSPGLSVYSPSFYPGTPLSPSSSMSSPNGSVPPSPFGERKLQVDGELMIAADDEGSYYSEEK